MFNKSIIVLAAGAGTRMKSDTPKVLHRISGKPMLYYSIKEALKLGENESSNIRNILQKASEYLNLSKEEILKLSLLKIESKINCK